MLGAASTVQAVGTQAKVSTEPQERIALLSMTVFRLRVCNYHVAIRVSLNGFRNSETRQ